jgi:outer membrane protein
MLLFLVSIVWAAQPLTLEEALSQAMQDNLELSSQRRENAIATLGLHEAQAAFDPRVGASFRTGGSATPTNDLIDGNDVVTSTSNSWSTGVSANLPTGGSVSADLAETTFRSDSANAASAQFTTDSVGLSLSQPLLQGAFFGGISSLRDASLQVLEQELRWRAQLEELVLQVSDAYWGLVLARQGKQLAEQAVALANRQLAETEERKLEGFAGSGDVLQVQVAVGTARRDLVDADASQQAAEARLARILGLPVNSGAELEPTDLPQDLEEATDRSAMVESALARNAEFLLEGIRRERSTRDARRARNRALPNISLDGSAGWSSGAESAAESRAGLTGSASPSWGVGASVGLPLLMRDTRAQYGMAKLRQEQAEIALKAAHQDLILEVDRVRRAVTRDRASLLVAQQTLEHATLSLEAQRELLDEGRGSTRDVVDALESLRAAEADKLEAEIATQNSLMRVLRVSGTLLDDE